MTASKPVYSLPSDDEAMPTPKPPCSRKRPRRRHKDVRTTDTPSADAAREDGGIAERACATDGQNCRNDSFDHHERNRRTHRRERRRLADLRAENERLHRRLAAVYDALNLD